MRSTTNVQTMLWSAERGWDDYMTAPGQWIFFCLSLSTEDLCSPKSGKDLLHPLTSIWSSTTPSDNLPVCVCVSYQRRHQRAISSIGQGVALGCKWRRGDVNGSVGMKCHLCLLFPLCRLSDVWLQLVSSKWASLVKVKWCDLRDLLTFSTVSACLVSLSMNSRSHVHVTTLKDFEDASQHCKNLYLCWSGDCSVTTWNLEGTPTIVLISMVTSDL